MSDVQEVNMQQCALAGINADELWIIPVELENCSEFPLTEKTKFIRLMGGIYTFMDGWTRKDGEPCEAKPGMVYVLGHVAHALPKPKED